MFVYIPTYRKVTAAFVALFLLFAGASAAHAGGRTDSSRHGWENAAPPAPKCVEDEMVRGTGEFANGYWSEYVCTHPDVVTAQQIRKYPHAIAAYVVDSVCKRPKFWERQGIGALVEETCH